MPDYSIEQRVLDAGFHHVAGVDEAGRGPLAGPVVAAAVVFESGDSACTIARLDDSKQLSASARETAYGAIVSTALGWSTACIDANEIDRINILQASLKAMALAVASLPVHPQYVLVDGIHPPTRHMSPLDRPEVECIVKGDARCLSVAAASIVAKVTRDRMMVAFAARYPEYGFEGHKGYPSEGHRQAIAEHGVCPIHRRTFRGVREHC